MEKARFTLFQPRSWMNQLGRFVLAALFVWSIGLQTVSAQKAVLMPSDSTSIADTLTACSGTVDSNSPVVFTDDGSTDGLYADDNVRADTTTFCPTNQWSRVKVVFTDFDIAKGDTLYAFQGNVAALNNSTLAAAIKKGILPDTADLADLKILLNLQGSEAKVDSATLRGAIKIGLLPLGADTLPNAFDALKLLISLQGNPMIGPADTIAVMNNAINLGLLVGRDSTQAGFTEYLTCFTQSGTRLLRNLFGAGAASAGTGTGTSVGATNLATARGGSVSDAFGGWIDASCEPALNPSGCLTFVFNTNGDRAKGSGWEAWVDCEERAIELAGATVPNDVNLPCRSRFALDAANADTVSLSIVTPSVMGCGDETFSAPSDSILVEVKNEAGRIIKTARLLSADAATGNTLVGTYGVGCYSVVFKLISDPTKVTEPEFFCVNAPYLACNDEVNTVFGSACQLSVTPDMILENPCDTNAFLTYTINFKFGDKTVATGTLADLPVISQDSLVSAGASACSGELIVEIIRTITTPDTTSTGATVCSNGPQIANCLTTLKYTDNTAPVFVNRTPNLDTLIQADTIGITALIDAPTATDNCSTPNVTSTIKEVRDSTGTNLVDPSNICVYPIKVVIEHIATDECDNTSNILTDTIVVIRPFEWTTLGIDSLECNAEDPGYLASGAPELQVGRIVDGDTIYVDSLALAVDTLSYTAGYILRYTDQVINDNECGSKVFRAYSYVDWCNDSPGIQAIGTQFIHYFDQSAPEFTYVGVDTIESEATKINLDFGECTQAINPAAPSAMDGCDTNPTVAMFSVMQLVDSVYMEIGANLAETGPLSCDTFRIRWRVFDACHTQLVEDTIDTYYIIQDVEDPVVTCEDQVYVSVSNSGGVVMDVATFYKTAKDNCDSVRVLVRREGEGDDAWRSSILVTCTDVDHNSFNVEVEVTDKNGRANRCWVQVTPEDKIAPICNDIPNDTTRFCDEFHNLELGKSTDTNGDGLMDDGSGTNNGEWVVLDKTDAELDALRLLLNEEFGTPVCMDNLDECGAIDITQSYQLIEDGCGVIRIKRKWSATDWGAQGGVNTSQEQEQSITIRYRQDWTLSFPADATLTCGQDGIPAPATFDEIVTSGACDNFLLNVTADTFRTPGETCMKLIRTYELINWCVYDPDMSGYVIPHNVNGFAIADDTIANNQGKFTYSQVIKLDVSDGGIIFDTPAPVEECIIGMGDIVPFGQEDTDRGFNERYECDTVRTFTASAQNCLGIPLTKFSHRVTVDGAEIANADGNEVTVNVEPGREYRVTFNAFDDCNNSNSIERIYNFRDCKRPTPYVLNGIAIELGQGGSVALWAKDLDQNSYDNCTNANDLDFYISREKLGDDLADIRAAGSSITLDCNDVGTRVVFIYVVDASGNWDFVETFVLVESNIFDCVGDNEEGMVAGHIVNPNGENVEQVAVSIAGATQESMTTGADGGFQFSLTTGANYTVTPVKDMNPLNGVSTFDLVLISKHILGITTFDSPYKHIAADVNKSGTITAFDMVQLRQLILNINTEFSNNDSWRFVDTEHDFSASTDSPAAQDFAEFKSISQLSANRMNLDFIGVKVGDVNGSSAANSLLGAESRTTYGTLNFNVTDRLVEEGETVTVDFTSADIATAQGYQFTMNFAGLNLTKLEEGVAKAANFNTSLAERNMLTTSWNGQATANDVLFSLTFNATSNGLLSELITLNSDLTTAEAYNTDGELLNVNIEFTTVDADFALAQNVPNPFSGETVVSFNLPIAGVATLTVMDVQGKVLKEIKGDYAKGYNQVTLKAKELTTGVLYYQLESADQVATKKMIIID